MSQKLVCKTEDNCILKIIINTLMASCRVVMSGLTRDALSKFLYMLLSRTSRFWRRLKRVFFRVQTRSSCDSSGMTRKVLHPWIFFDFKMSPKMWSPMYKTSLPLAPIKLENTSQQPVGKIKWLCGHSKEKLKSERTNLNTIVNMNAIEPPE